MANNAINEEGLERSAILMMTLDEDTAAEVFKFLSPRDVQQLGMAMAGLRQVSRERIAEVLNLFHSELDQLSAIDINSSDHIRTVLVKALGEDRAASMLAYSSWACCSPSSRPSLKPSSYPC